MPDSAAPVYAFEGFRLLARTRQLLAADGRPLALGGKALDVLLYLVEHADRVVGKDELLAEVWAGRVVEENTLTQAVSALRHALGTGAGDHRFVLTVPGRGYRFVAAVIREPDIPAASPAPREPAPGPRRWRPALAVAAALSLVLALAATPWRAGSQRQGDALPVAGLAVLPFHAVAAAQHDELLAMGLAETLIARLSRADALQVSSLAASQRVAEDGRDPVDAGRRLGVAYVVAGSTQQVGEQLRVNARLLAVADGRTLWAGTFDAPRERAFTLQDAIAAEIGAALALRAGVAPPRYRSPCDGEHADAYRGYLAGRHLMNRLDAQRLPDALAAMHRAIALDPMCARAYAALASLHVSSTLIADADPREAMPLAQAAVERALALDPASAEAHVARGNLSVWWAWDWARASEDYRRAIALDPGSPEALMAYAGALAWTGRAEEAAAHMRRASELDPLSPRINTAQAAYLSERDPAAGSELLAGVLALEPDYWSALLERSAWAWRQGNREDAVADMERAAERSGRNSMLLAFLAKTYIDAGRRDRAQALLRELQARRLERHVPASAIARIHNALGDTGRALDELERAWAERDVRLVYLGQASHLANLREQPRFAALLARIQADADIAASHRQAKSGRLP